MTLPYLRNLLQDAVKVEHSTIPLYLTALYSMVDTGSFAAQAVRGVVIEVCPVLAACTAVCICDRRETGGALSDGGPACRCRKCCT